MSDFIHSTVIVHLLRAHLCKKINKMKSNAGCMQTMQPESQNNALAGTNLGAIINTYLKLYLGLVQGN